MSLLNVIRSAVKVANNVTKPLQASVTYQQFASASGDGEVTPNSPVSLQAIVEFKQRAIRTQGGETAISNSSVLFLDVAALIAATGGKGIGQYDSIILPDGTTGSILGLGGFVDAGTGHPFATEVYLG